MTFKISKTTSDFIYYLLTSEKILKSLWLMKIIFVLTHTSNFFKICICFLTVQVLLYSKYFSQRLQSGLILCLSFVRKIKVTVSEEELFLPLIDLTEEPEVG